MIRTVVPGRVAVRQRQRQSLTRAALLGAQETLDRFLTQRIGGQSVNRLGGKDNQIIFRQQLHGAVNRILLILGLLGSHDNRSHSFFDSSAAWWNGSPNP
jgi:hypothetical protein